MSVLFVEGFTGVPRGSSSPNATPAILSTMDWRSSAYYNGSSLIPSTDTNHNIVVEADPVFPSRNRVSINGVLVTAVTSYVNQIARTLNTLGYSKFVLGFVATYTGTATDANSVILSVMGPGTWTNSTGSGIANDTRFLDLTFPNNGSNGTAASIASGVAATTSPAVVKGTPVHVELLIEEDVDRLRVYLNGVLTTDGPYTGTFASATGGFSLAMRTGASQSNTANMKVSDLYMLGVDAVHTGILGPGARVLEVAPQADFAVQWDRPTGFASNAAVLQQYNSGAPASYLTTGDVATDLYVGPDAVAANAATVYGAAVKAYGMTMAEGTHVLTAATQYQGTDGQSAATGNLVLSTMNNYVFDVSLNPKTGLKWTPSEIAAAGIGIKLLS